MALVPGTRLGIYEVIAAIGEGGMGQVYRARDTKLNRDVALKVLPDSFAKEADRLARFTREAQTLAALNHPNIAHIHGLDEGQAGRVGPFLVMELVEGEDLTDRIARGPIPIDEALPIARQIAEALEAAHEQGIIHRDLKPANIKLRPDGTVKLLDFGLAKAIHQPDASGGPHGTGGTGRVHRLGLPDLPDRPDLPDPPDLTSPTLTSPVGVTGVGVILGTAAYMSPEQARGRPVDRRADVWAFGCVLFEMLTGRTAFLGSDVGETLANVIKADPDWVAIPSGTAAPLRRLLRRCLEKDLTRRLRDMGDARLEIDEAQAPTTGASENPRAPGTALSSRARLVVVAVGGVLALLGLGVGIEWSALRGQSQSTSPIWLSIPPPAGPFGARLSTVVSPDGTQVAFWAPDATGLTRLWVRPINEPAARSLPGTEGPNDPAGGRPIAWSPDGRSLAFIARGKLARIELAGGSPQPLADAGASPRGLAWGRTGRAPHAIEWPAFMPDGRHFLFYVTNNLADESEAGIYVGALDSADAARISTVRSRPDYARGHLFFVKDDALFAQAFDEARLATTGEPFRVAEGVGAMGSDRPAYSFSVSPAGPIVFSDAPFLPASQLTWLDRSGRTIGTVGEAARYFGFAMSGHDQSVVVERPADARSQTPSLWMMDRASGVPSLFTANGASPLWDTKNGRLLYQVNGSRLVQRPVRSSREEPIAVTGLRSRPWPEDISRDGSQVLFSVDDLDTQSDVWVLSLAGGSGPMPVLHTRAAERQARFSPDGHWIVFTSDESGRDEVYVQPFPEPGVKQRVSTGGGIRPLWRPDGREVYYLGPDQTFTAVRVTPLPDGVKVSAPESLFAITGLVTGSTYRQQIASAGNGDRFLMNLLAPEKKPTTITVLLNWSAPVQSARPQ